jgi:hypothetical protein
VREEGTFGNDFIYEYISGVVEEAINRHFSKIAFTTPSKSILNYVMFSLTAEVCHVSCYTINQRLSMS